MERERSVFESLIKSKEIMILPIADRDTVSGWAWVPWRVSVQCYASLCGVGVQVCMCGKGRVREGGMGEVVKVGRLPYMCSQKASCVLHPVLLDTVQLLASCVLLLPQVEPSRRLPAVHPDVQLLGAAANALTRRAGGRLSGKPLPRRIVVDVREFMSSLPAVLHQQVCGGGAGSARRRLDVFCFCVSELS